MQNKESGRGTLDCQVIFRILFAGRRSRGFGLIGWIIAIPFLIIAFVIIAIGFYEGRKAYWDAEVREMCAKDGGTQIFEKIIISKAQANALPKVGDFLGVATEALAKPSEPAYLRVRRVAIREGNPSILREEQEIVRKSDYKVIGRTIRYGRGGGDFPAYGHPTTYSCPEYVQIYQQLHDVYRIEDAAK